MRQGRTAPRPGCGATGWLAGHGGAWALNVMSRSDLVPPFGRCGPPSGLYPVSPFRRRSVRRRRTVCAMTTRGGERAKILIGLAAVAVTVAEMKHEEQQIVEAVGARMMQFDLVTAQDVRDVAHAVGDLPQPIDEPADVIERREPIREALGVTSATDELGPDREECARGLRRPARKGVARWEVRNSRTRYGAG